VSLQPRLPPYCQPYADLLVAHPLAEERLADSSGQPSAWAAQGKPTPRGGFKGSQYGTRSSAGRRWSETGASIEQGSSRRRREIRSGRVCVHSGDSKLRPNDSSAAIASVKTQKGPSQERTQHPHCEVIRECSSAPPHAWGNRIRDRDRDLRVGLGCGLKEPATTWGRPTGKRPGPDYCNREPADVRAAGDVDYSL
jgi:hypothetical protein